MRGFVSQAPDVVRKEEISSLDSTEPAGEILVHPGGQKRRLKLEEEQGEGPVLRREDRERGRMRSGRSKVMGRWKGNCDGGRGDKGLAPD